MNIDAISAVSGVIQPAHPRSVTAWSALVVCTASVAAGAGAWTIAGSDAPAGLIVLVWLAAAWALAGAVISLREPRPISAIAGGFAAFAAVGALSWSVGIWRDMQGAGALAVDVAQRLALTLAPALFFHMLMTLPGGRFSRPGQRTAVLAGYVVALGVGLALLIDRNTVTVWPIVLLWAATLGALPTAHANYRAAGVVDQRRMQWVGWAAVVALEITLVCLALSLVADWPRHNAVIAFACTGFVPLALAAGTVARLRSHIDRVLVHTVSLTGLTMLIVVAYALALAAFGRQPDGSEQSLLLLSMLAAAGAAMAYQPARARLGERANTVIYGARIAPEEAVRTWGSRLTRAIPLDELLLQLVETLRKSMQLRSAQIWTGTGAHYEIAAAVPHREPIRYTVGEKEQAVVSRAGVSGGTWIDIWLPGLVDAAVTASTRVAPIAHSGELLGFIVCQRPDDGAAFTEDDDRVLTELARQVGLALHNVQLDTALQASLDELRDTNEELRASRVRIVTAGDAERRKLERNLHDGAQQHLVALAVKLRLAKDAVVDDPADAEAMIDEIRGNLQEAITELRSLAHGIYPPLLMSGGLAEALPAAFARAALPTNHDIAVSRHPQEVEAAVYFCCMEALQNAGKHAGDGAVATIKVWEDQAGLHWLVSDDGEGFDATGDSEAGHGFVNMRDRMGAFGGTVDVTSVVGEGTTIRGDVRVG